MYVYYVMYMSLVYSKHIINLSLRKIGTQIRKILQSFTFKNSTNLIKRYFKQYNTVKGNKFKLNINETLR